MKVQQFFGVIHNIDGDDISAMVTDVTCKSNPDQFMVLVASAFNEPIQVGYEFMWDIYKNMDNTCSSTIRVIHHPKWTRKELAIASKHARKLAKIFKGKGRKQGK